ncbi:MAG: lytic transglycosylase domain-containing protein [Betaproteobacteria bacterium]|nr:lytic transglycosylase domain-containing protein [Betaproteobacteria bacterium]
MTLLAMCYGLPAMAGHQLYEPLSNSVCASLSSAVSDSPVTHAALLESPDAKAWLQEMSRRLARRMPDSQQRMEFLSTVYYESVRAGLDPEMVMGLIEVESGFNKYALSTADARGYMQVMPFWVGLVGTKGQDLFHLRTNLRYGCNILRLYVDMENGNLYRALGRYNGSLGQPQYPMMVVEAWKKHWSY